MRSYENYEMKLKDIGFRLWWRGYHIAEGAKANGNILVATRDERRIVMKLRKSKMSVKLAIWVNENRYVNYDTIYMIMEGKR